MGMVKQDTSGITPFALVAVCAGIGAAFILAIAVAFICKAVNRPTEEAMPYLINGHGALYQPSAAGYGAQQGNAAAAGKKGAAPGAGAGGSPGRLELSRTASIASHSRTNLLDNAQPMGRDDSFNQQNNFSRTHTRGTSTSISQNPFPAAPLAARRPGFGGGGAHPPLPGQPIAPDGSGFTPGQLFRNPSGGPPGQQSPFAGGALGGGFSGSSPHAFLNVNPSAADAPRPSRDTNRMSMVSMARGPPPATAESRRRSRYSRIGGPGPGSGPDGNFGPGGGGGGNRQSRRVDSVGPGVLRKSMFLTADAQFPGLEALQRTASKNGSNSGYPPAPAATSPSAGFTHHYFIGGPDGSMGPGGTGAGVGGAGVGGGGGGGGGNRQSRRIDSVGPGVLRKSMFMNADSQFPGLEALQRTASNNGGNNGYPPSSAPVPSGYAHYLS
ncbi:hypothetical protein OC835_002292 [Tilletia horrida]|nr:hypothetical protein OC835_002292 [Tilletia horrida]